MPALTASSAAAPSPAHCAGCWARSASYSRSRRAAGSEARYARPIELDSIDSRDPTPSPDDPLIAALSWRIVSR